MKTGKTIKYLYPVLIAMAIVFISIWSNKAMASPIFIGETKDLKKDSTWAAQGGKKAHQDTEFNINWLVDTQLTLLGKWDKGWENGAAWGEDTPLIGGSFTGTSGDWWADYSLSGIPLYYSLKAGREFELYQTDGDLEGLWDTLGITNGQDKAKRLSHISFWTAESSAPIPEPSTILLLGLGLLGFTGFARKKLHG